MAKTDKAAAAASLSNVSEEGSLVLPRLSAEVCAVPNERGWLRCLEY